MDLQGTPMVALAIQQARILPSSVLRRDARAKTHPGKMMQRGWRCNYFLGKYSWDEGEAMGGTGWPLVSLLLNSRSLVHSRLHPSSPSPSPSGF